MKTSRVIPIIVHEVMKLQNFSRGGSPPDDDYRTIRSMYEKTNVSASLNNSDILVSSKNAMTSSAKEEGISNWKMFENLTQMEEDENVV